MALIFQYGSNLDVSRINGVERLNGQAIPLGVGELGGYQIVFNVWSKTNDCAVTNIQSVHHLISTEILYGVLFYVPDQLLPKLRSIEGCNSRTYREIAVKVNFRDSFGNINHVPALTYIGDEVGLKNFEEATDKRISNEYALHILEGIQQFKMPGSYIHKVEEIIKEHNEKYIQGESQETHSQKEIIGVVARFFSEDPDYINRSDIVRLRKSMRNKIGISTGGKVRITSTGGGTGIFIVMKGPDANHPDNWIYMSQAARRKIGVNEGDQIILKKE